MRDPGPETDRGGANTLCLFAVSFIVASILTSSPLGVLAAIILLTLLRRGSRKSLTDLLVGGNVRVLDRGEER
jgi:hypothetical protein